MMETLGKILQRTRLARGLSLEDVIEQSKISPVYLQALESDEWGPIPSEVFARGFVRSYGRCLGLDENELLTTHGPAIHAFFEAREEKASEPERRRAAIHEAERAKTRSRLLSAGLVLAGAGVIALLVVFVLKTSRDESRPPRVAMNPPVVSPVVRPSPVVTVRPQRVVVPSPEPAVPESHELILRAKETTWAQVLIDGETMREVLLQPGDSVIWEAERTFKLDVGNAGGVIVTLDGRELPPLGESGKVLKGVELPTSGAPAKPSGDTP